MKVGLRTRLKPGAEAEYERAHAAVWPEILALLRDVGITEYLIFRDGLDLFHCVECDDYDAAVAAMTGSQANERWQAEMGRLTDVAHDLSGEGRDRMALIFEL